VSVLAIAHRAGNSLDRLHTAVALGADVIEADVHSYRGQLEVRHEKTMGPLPWLWDKWELRSARAPRLGLEELLLAARHGATFMLDIKGRRVAAGEEVARHLHTYAPERPVVVCTRFWPALRAFERIPWVRTVRSARKRGELSLLLHHLRRHGPEYGVSVHRSLLTPSVVAELHRYVEIVMTWPVNDSDALAEVLAHGETGAVGVISDEDDVLRRVLAGR